MILAEALIPGGRGAEGRAAAEQVEEALISGLSTRQLARYFSRSTFANGERYYRQRRVLSVAWESAPDGDGRGTLLGKVRGSEYVPYVVEVDLEQLADGSLAIEGACTCPAGLNCKHVAATLIAASAEGPKRQLGAAQLSVYAAAAARDTLSPALTSWIEELARLEDGDDEGYPADVKQRLIYLLAVERRPRGPAQLVVSTVSTRVLKNGEFSFTSQWYNPASALQPMSASFLRPSDRSILRRVALASWRTAYIGGRGGSVLGGEDGVSVLQAIVATGRARWNAIEGSLVTVGAPRTARLGWALGDDAALHVEVEIEGEGPAQALSLAPPWYADEQSGVIGPLETGLSPRVAAGLLAAPAVPGEQATLLRQAIDRRLPALTSFGPPELGPAREVGGPPTPRLTLTAIDRYQPYGWHAGAPTTVSIARLSFLYAGAEISEHDDRARPTTVRDGSVVGVVRNRRMERQARNLLTRMGFARLSRFRPQVMAPGQRDDFSLAEDPDGSPWLEMLHRGLPALREAGWEVVIDPAFPMRVVHPDGPIEANLREGSGIDWLELDLGVLIDGERFELTPTLVGMISDPHFDPELLSEAPGEDETIFLSLAEGRTLAMPALRIWNIVRALYELFAAGMFGAKDTAVRFSPFDAAALAGTEAATAEGVVWHGGERLRQLGELLRSADGIPRVEVPASFRADLRPYQARGVDWLQFLRAAGLGAVLADDMGLGKTVQTLAHLLIEKESGRLNRPALIVSPTSVVPNWRQEAARFAPDLKVLVLQGPARQGRFSEIAAHDIVITTYPLLARDRAVLLAHEWHVVVLDEAQAIKNPDAIAARMARELKADQRLCLTGTPVENHLGELWSLFSFLSPGFLGDRVHFNRAWRRPIEVDGNDERRRQLARRVRPFLLRRTKSEVAAELPPKTEIVEHVEMEQAQRDVYETVRLAMHERVREAIAAQGLARSQIVVLDALLKMRQACCDPRLLKLETAKAMRARSAKFDRLMEMLPELLEEGRHVLLFSQFTSMLALIEVALKEAGIRYTLLTGDTRDRETPVNVFQSGEVPLFLISLKAGGVGLNLTAADTVIHYDPWWNPAVEDQATDRAHRIGQEKPVFVYRLVTLSSIEEKMEGLKARKRDLAAGIFDPDSGATLELSEADVEALFAPA